MKKVKGSTGNDLRPEYTRADLGQGVRGKYLKQYRAGTNLALLAPDVAAALPTASAINDALRTLLHLAKAAKVAPPRTRRIGRKRAVA
ncbi:MAG: hypothetical protein EHM71_17600 [Zetaproteobacteria bacterium]|nr:MAG: hypothetical protein EHM71_17600 [Zetaproteobacteria bacterium]